MSDDDPTAKHLPNRTAFLTVSMMVLFLGSVGVMDLSCIGFDRPAPTGAKLHAIQRAESIAAVGTLRQMGEELMPLCDTLGRPADLHELIEHWGHPSLEPDQVTGFLTRSGFCFALWMPRAPEHGGGVTTRSDQLDPAAGADDWIMTAWPSRFGVARERCFVLRPGEELLEALDRGERYRGPQSPLVPYDGFDARGDEVNAHTSVGELVWKPLE